MHVKLLSSEAFLSPKCSKYCAAAGLRPPPRPSGGAWPPSSIKGPYFYRVRKGRVCLLLFFLLATTPLLPWLSASVLVQKQVVDVFDINSMKLIVH